MQECSRATAKFKMFQLLLKSGAISQYCCGQRSDLISRHGCGFATVISTIKILEIEATAVAVILITRYAVNLLSLTFNLLIMIK